MSGNWGPATAYLEKISFSNKQKFKILTLTGATGYLGSNLIPFLLDNYGIGELRALGRNEWKLEQLADTYGITPMICDIRDESRVNSCLENSDVVIHAAALKRVTMGALNPMEIIKTNVIGSMNVLHACINHNVKRLIAISSDKAVEPLNLYGITKACAERMFYERSKMKDCPVIIKIVRYGNLISSRGAFIPRAIKDIKIGKQINITDMDMTRFIFTKQEALNLIKQAIEDETDNIVILPDFNTVRKARLGDMIQWLKEYYNSDSKINIIGRFSGEKLHESLAIGITSEKVNVAKEEFLAILKEEKLI